MQVVGKVIELDNDMVYVTLLRTSACGGNCKACGASCETIEHRIKAVNSIDAKLGDLVEIAMDDKNGLKASAILYLIPFLGFISGIFAAYFLKLSEAKVFLSGIFGLIISYLIVHFIDKKNRGVNQIVILPFK